MEECDPQVAEFVNTLSALSVCIAEVIRTGDVSKFTRMNSIVKEMYALQHGSDRTEFVAVDEDCRVVYANFDMIVAVLRTTEDGVIDKGAQTAINKFLHNMHEAVIGIASTYGLI